MSRPDVSRRMVTEAFEKQKKLVAGLTGEEAAIIGIPTAVLFYIPNITIGGNIPLYLSGLYFILSLVVVKMTPPYLTPTEWISGLIQMKLGSDKISHNRVVDIFGRKQKDDYDTNIVTFENRTQDLTRLKRIYKKYDVVERPDGAIVGALKVDPLNLTLKTDEQINNIIEQFITGLNNTVDEKITIYSRPKEFDIEKHIDRYKKRQKELEDLPLLNFLMEVQIRRFPKKLRQVGIYEREYYIVVEVTPEPQDVPAGIQDLNFGQKTVEMIWRKLYGSKKSKGEAIDKVRENLKKINRQCISQIENLNARKLTAKELGALVRNFWRNDDITPERMEKILENPQIKTSHRDIKKTKQKIKNQNQQDKHQQPQQESSN